MAHADAPRRSFLEQLRPKKRPVAEEPDDALDDALVQLTRAVSENEGAAAGVRRRQSSGQLKLVAVPEGG